MCSVKLTCMCHTSYFVQLFIAGMINSFQQMYLLMHSQLLHSAEQVTLVLCLGWRVYVLIVLYFYHSFILPCTDSANGYRSVYDNISHQVAHNKRTAAKWKRKMSLDSRLRYSSQVIKCLILRVYYYTLKLIRQKVELWNCSGNITFVSFCRGHWGR